MEIGTNAKGPPASRFRGDLEAIAPERESGRRAIEGRSSNHGCCPATGSIRTCARQAIRWQGRCCRNRAAVLSGPEPPETRSVPAPGVPRDGPSRQASRQPGHGRARAGAFAAVSPVLMPRAGGRPAPQPVRMPTAVDLPCSSSAPPCCRLRSCCCSAWPCSRSVPASGFPVIWRLRHRWAERILRRGSPHAGRRPAIPCAFP